MNVYRNGCIKILSATSVGFEVTAGPKIYFENKSVDVMMYGYLPEFGNQPTMSTCVRPHGKFVSESSRFSRVVKGSCLVNFACSKDNKLVM